MWKYFKINIYLILLLATLTKCETEPDDGNTTVSETSVTENGTETTHIWETVSSEASDNNTVKYDSTVNYESTVNYVTTTEFSTTEVETVTSSTYTMETTRNWEPADKVIEANKTEIDNNTRKIRNVTNKFCPHFIRSVTEFDVSKMMDVWQTMYYTFPTTVKCFKIFIKKILGEEKDIYQNMYGNFSNAINWKKCNVEIRSANDDFRKHLLQDLDDSNDGVMDNLIITEGNLEGIGEPDNLKQESPDQWVVIKNLLLMRDCRTGGVLVFSRVPYQPSHDELEEALKDFGENEREGKMACEDNEIIKAYDADEETSTDF